MQVRDRFSLTGAEKRRLAGLQLEICFSFEQRQFAPSSALSGGRKMLIEFNAPEVKNDFQPSHSRTVYKCLLFAIPSINYSVSRTLS